MAYLLHINMSNAHFVRSAAATSPKVPRGMGDIFHVLKTIDTSIVTSIACRKLILISNYEQTKVSCSCQLWAKKQFWKLAVSIGFLPWRCSIPVAEVCRALVDARSSEFEHWLKKHASKPRCHALETDLVAFTVTHALNALNLCFDGSGVWGDEMKHKQAKQHVKLCQTKVCFHNTMVDRITSQREGCPDVPRAEWESQSPFLLGWFWGPKNPTLIWDTPDIPKLYLKYP